MAFGESHGETARNEAWWTLDKRKQERYDPVRETEWLRAVAERLNAVAK